VQSLRENDVLDNRLLASSSGLQTLFRYVVLSDLGPLLFPRFYPKLFKTSPAISAASFPPNHYHVILCSYDRTPCEFFFADLLYSTGGVTNPFPQAFTCANNLNHRTCRVMVRCVRQAVQLFLLCARPPRLPSSRPPLLSGHACRYRASCPSRLGFLFNFSRKLFIPPCAVDGVIVVRVLSPGDCTAFDKRGEYNLSLAMGKKKGMNSVGSFFVY
jgi:hypothetical protein